MIPDYLSAFLRAGTVPGSNFAASGSPHGTAAPERLSELAWEGNAEPAQGGSAAPRITPQRMGHVVPNQGGSLTSVYQVMPQPKPGTARELQSGATRKIPVEFVHQFIEAKMLCQNTPVLAEITPGMSWEPPDIQSSSQHRLPGRETSAQDPTVSSSHQASPPKPPGAKPMEQNHWSKTIQGCGAKPSKGVEHHKKAQVSGQAFIEQKIHRVKSAAPQAGNSSSPSPTLFNKAGKHRIPLENPSILQTRQADG